MLKKLLNQIRNKKYLSTGIVILSIVYLPVFGGGSIIGEFKEELNMQLTSEDSQNASLPTESYKTIQPTGEIEIVPEPIFNESSLVK